MQFSGLGTFSRAVLLALASTAGLALAGPGSAGAAPPAPGAPSTADHPPALLVDAGSGTILHAHAPDRRWYPASLTKLMTLYLTFQAMAEGRLEPDRRLPVSRHASAQPPTRLGLAAGTTITARAALEAVATVSANDAAVVLAEAIAGSEAAFVARQNRMAARLGLTRTRFRNATGLPGSDQWTTARDMARLALALHEHFPRERAVFSLAGVSHHGRRLATHNGALARIEGGDGLKTGFTCDAGYNIVLSAEREGRRLVAVVLGAPTRAERDRNAVRLIADGFRRSPPGAGPPVHEAPPGTSSPAPPRRLDAAACGSPGVRWARNARDLRGWGILLGVFVDESAAGAQLDAVRAALAAREPGQGDAERARAVSVALPAGAQPALLPRSLGSRPSWKLVVAGLSREQAGAACKHLERGGNLCLAQSPERIALPAYADH